MKTCSTCGVHFLEEQLQEVKLNTDDGNELVCENCVRVALLIAGQAKLPGWVAAVFQPRHLHDIASRHFRLCLPMEQLIELAESGREAASCFMNEGFLDFWRDLGIEEWLKDMEIIENGKVVKNT